MVSSQTVSPPSQYAVIGDPVEHSLSPRLFQWLFAELGIAGAYSALRVPPAELAGAVEKVRSGELDGISVTLPHKEAVTAFVDQLDPLARQIGAVNCLVHQAPGKISGWNTDGIGFRRALEAAGVKLAGARVLMLGAGGAARAATFSAVEAGARSLTIANRNVQRAFRLSRDLITGGMAHSSTESADEGCSLQVLAMSSPLLSQEPADIVVNATSVGLRGNEGDPLPPTVPLSARTVVLDMVYRSRDGARDGPLETALLSRARAAGATAVDGLWMLVYQAFEQLRLWTGRQVNSDLAARLHAHLTEEAR